MVEHFHWNSCCNFDVEFETTGPCGGDGGHGGYTEITFTNRGGTGREIAPDEGLKPQQCSSFKIRFRGDDEMRGLAEALFSVGKRLYLKYHPLPIVDELARHLEVVERRPENDPDYLDFEKQAEQHFVETAN